MGLPIDLQTLIHRVSVVGADMTTWLPPGLDDPLASGAPPLERGLGGGGIEVP